MKNDEKNSEQEDMQSPILTRVADFKPGYQLALELEMERRRRSKKKKQKTTHSSSPPPLVFLYYLFFLDLSPPSATV